MAENKGLVDISNITIDTSLEKEKRIEKFVAEVGDPYHFMVGEVEVMASFDADGESMQEVMERYYKARSSQSGIYEDS